MDLKSGLLNTAAVSAVMLAAYFILERLAAFRPRPGDRRRLALNVAPTATVFAVNLLLFGAGLAVVHQLNAQGFGLAQWLDLPLWVSILLAVVVLDLATWALHWAMHKTPLLWRLHRLHHADAFVDVTTTLRQHPGETILRTAVTLAAGALLGAPLAVIAAYRLLSVLNAIAEHANFRLPRPLDRMLARIWVTPDMHKMHHSNIPAQTDSNYGNLLSLFDRAFGTYTCGSGAGAVVYGLGPAAEGGRRWNRSPALSG
ncbi:MAG TPA: sterol desaturase family protein [Caulobacteraceae bacterium]|nr:sterol desaturase family protein [Caulobacteraceae bacterium]